MLLAKGNFRIDLTTGSVTLEKQGDYAVWGPGIDHSWEALSESIVLTVRWPSAVRAGEKEAGTEVRYLVR
jgi:quercetin dioxygenase-like cupin family protein